MVTMKIISHFNLQYTWRAVSIGRLPEVEGIGNRRIGTLVVNARTLRYLTDIQNFRMELIDMENPITLSLSLTTG